MQLSKKGDIFLIGKEVQGLVSNYAKYYKLKMLITITNLKFEIPINRILRNTLDIQMAR